MFVKVVVAEVSMITDEFAQVIMVEARLSVI